MCDPSQGLKKNNTHQEYQRDCYEQVYQKTLSGYEFKHIQNISEKISGAI
jgi:hypothetical protein